MNKITTLMKMIFKHSLAYKIVFMYTFAAPILYMFFEMWNDPVNYQVSTTEEYITVYVPYIAFIVVTNIINNISMKTLIYRESGFYKIISYVASNQYIFYLSIAIVQYALTIIQVVLFWGIVAIFLGNYSLYHLLIVLSISTVVFIPLMSVFGCITILKVKQETLSVMGAVILACMFFLLQFDGDNWWQLLLLGLNPLKYVLIVGELFGGQGGDIFIISLISFVYLAVGYYSIYKFSIDPYENRIV